ncbi:unnamed protein product [Adineta steineri]|uniref:Palmitoyltransferase n=1 Tax=Adineta steineri TaxID=433720 RepID=A0A815RNV9_9BILA|nr:unnamed protein product [Adineta steineri]CAF1477567.1 unnamed protein product [Adineta steineri]CAF1552456.1 unnamed protein product [Adineta steineri]
MSLTELLPSIYHHEDTNDDIEVGSSAVQIHRYGREKNTEWPAETPNASSSKTTTTMGTDDTGVVIKDVVPRSMYYHDRDDHNDDDCLCTCACCRCECCPTVSDWCIRDPYGLSCGFTTWFLFIYAQFVVIFVILIPKSHSTLFNVINLLIFHMLEILAVSSHCITMFSNPGAVPLNNATPENLIKYSNGTVVYRCAMCQSVKPPRSHHCSVCKRCIKRMDHHCVFVNNCVGQNNQKYFILFTFYTCIISIYALILLGFHITTCVQTDWTACTAWSPPATIIFLIFLAFEAISFSLFTAIMTGTQLYSIYTDTTGIESFKGESSYRRRHSSFISSMKVVFGSQVGLTWLNPFSKPVSLITQNDERVTFDV